ncbi:MAG: hypothetical protein ACK4Q5_15570 [Saprospiraceae bacterium]
MAKKVIDKRLGLGEKYDWRGFRYMKKRNPCAKSKDFWGMTITSGFIYLCGENQQPEQAKRAFWPGSTRNQRRHIGSAHFFRRHSLA